MKTMILKPMFKDDIKGRVTKPSVPVTDPAFRYTTSVNTNLAATFARARKQLRGIEQ